MFEGVYPARIRCSAVEDPMVPPPPTTITLVVARDDTMVVVFATDVRCE